MALDGWLANGHCYGDVNTAAQIASNDVRYTDGVVNVYAQMIGMPYGSPVMGHTAYSQVEAVVEAMNGSGYFIKTVFVTMTPCEVDMTNVFSMTVAQGVEVGMYVWLACAVAWGFRMLGNYLWSNDGKEE